MFQDIINQIDSSIKNLTTSAEILIFLNKKLIELQKILLELNSIISSFNPVQKSIDYVESIKTDILYKYVMSGIEETEEFNIPIFRTRLVAAVYKPESIRIQRRGNSIAVYINLNETAGTLEDYGRSISATRDALGLESFRRSSADNPAAWASWMWEEKYYKPAREGTSISHPTGRNVNVAEYVEKYWKTIRTRVSFFQGLAPFWQLIDKGNVPLSSDWGGTPYPNHSGYNFTDKTRNELHAEFNKRFSIENGNLNQLSLNRNKVESAIQYAIKLLEEVGVDPLRKFAIERFRQQLGERFSGVDSQRLDGLIDKLLKDEITQEKYTLGYTSQKTVIRPRVAAIRKAIQAFRQGR